MKYPDDPKPGEWYMWANLSSPSEQSMIKQLWRKIKGSEPAADLTFFTHVSNEFILNKGYFQKDRCRDIFLVMSKIGAPDGQRIILGSVEVARKDFPEKWRELVREGKERVDRINSIEVALNDNPIQCANCENLALSNDYLCQDCRNAD